jgi:hypothetical protein
LLVKSIMNTCCQPFCLRGCQPELEPGSLDHFASHPAGSGAPWPSHDPASEHTTQPTDLLPSVLLQSGGVGAAQ